MQKEVLLHRVPGATAETLDSLMRVDCVAGKRIILEVATTTHNTPQSHIVPGHAAAIMELLKIIKYKTHANDGLSIQPIVVDDFGCFGNIALQTFRWIAECKQGTRNEQQVFLTYWKRRLAVCAAKGCTSIIADGLRHLLPPRSSGFLPPEPRAAFHRHGFISS